MSLVLKAIHLYSNDGKTRTVHFNETGLNIITGDSKTGKSAIIDIIDYCFGSSKCRVADGVIRRKVSWFAVDIKNEESELFIARRNPGTGINTSADIYIQRGEKKELPKLSELDKNITAESLVRFLSRFTGISENENRPLTGTRGPLQATIRHALFLCFQEQGEIDSRERLFHRQGDQFIPQAIKDTIPYFIGAVDEEHFLKQDELDSAKEKLRTLKANKEQQSNSTQVSLPYLRRLINDGKRVGIIQQDLESTNEEILISALEKANKVDIASENFVPDFGNTINQLKNELKTLRDSLSDNAEEIRAARLFWTEQNDYLRESSEQKARLISIGLYKSGDGVGDVCPLCMNQLETPTPSVRAINSSLKELESQLSAVKLESPHVQKHIAELENKGKKLEQSLIETQASFRQAIATDEKAKAQQDALIDRARVVGRISSYLDVWKPSENDVDYDALIRNAEAEILALEQEICAEDIGQRVDTYLNLISKKMSEYSQELDLEHSGSALRLDLKKLTVVADTEDGPIPLNRMGSGENWVGYHVLTHLALHSWLRHKNRPTPGFLVFDQPSQAHYSHGRDNSGKLDPRGDKDRQAVHSLFVLMNKACNEIGHGFQLIVLDHAHLDDKWFNDAVIEEWRDGKYLVPEDWKLPS